MKDGLLPLERYGYDFIPPEYLPPGKDEYWLRNRQRGAGTWRNLRRDEIETLEQNNNHCPRWEDVLVTDPFDPALVRNSAFYGLVRLGVLREGVLRHHDFQAPAGIRNSTVISCDIGDDPAIQDCSYISHYIIGDQVILSRVDELETTNHAKFGNGAIKDGEDEEVRIWIDVMNEAGGRSILPFAEMICADAFLWGAYRDDAVLMERLKAITQERYGGSRGSYGTIGSGAVIKSCKIIKDCAVGEAAYIKGANKLKNLTIHSSREEPSQIGEGVELINGIVGCGCHAFYGSKAVRFVMGRNCNLKYGARLIHSVLGDNSTVSCCEILNNLIFPIHEQHHNNSFLIAGLIQGLSNMAAGATIGSNHNSRANDGEIRAGRGFWPGLSVTLKHSSRFASFVLIAKGDYPYELNITLPFSLVNHNVRQDRLEVMPAYFWMYNLYALERNSWKAVNRDKRKVKVQHIETDYLAPDTADEIVDALGRMEGWMADAGMNMAPSSPAVIRTEGQAAQEEDPEYAYYPMRDEEIPAAGLERHKRRTVLLKPRRAWIAYREMLYYYAVKTLAEYLDARPETDVGMMGAALQSPARSPGWVNLGGQIAPAWRIDDLRAGIREGRITGWAEIHGAYNDMARSYPEDRARHAWGIWAYLAERGGPPPPQNRTDFIEALEALRARRRWITEQVYLSRAKDFHDPFRAVTYRGLAEMEQVVGRAEDNSFVLISRKALERFEVFIDGLIGKMRS